MAEVVRVRCPSIVDLSALHRVPALLQGLWVVVPALSLWLFVDTANAGGRSSQQANRITQQSKLPIAKSSEQSSSSQASSSKTAKADKDQDKSQDKNQDKNKNKNNDDDDDDDDNKDSIAKKDDNSSNRAHGKSTGGDDADAPQTVVELIQRLFKGQPLTGAVTDTGGKPKNAEFAKAAAHSVADSSPGTEPSLSRKTSPITSQVKASPQIVKTGGRAQAARAGQVLREIVRPSDVFRRDEILVLNAGQALTRLVKREFVPVETISLPSLQLKVSRLAVPIGHDALTARSLLQAEFPGLASAYNFVYRPYHAETERRQGPGGQDIPKHEEGCSPDRCYGATMINWRPHLSECTTGINIGVIDTDFDRQHPAFSGRKISWGTVLENESVKAPDWHGTGILSLLSGNPHSSTPGLIPDANFFATDTFYADDHGQPVTDTGTLLKALNWMEAFDVRIINLSLAGPRDEVLHRAIQRMSSRGVIFVAAAGNGGPSAPPSYPGAYREVISVTAVDRNLKSYRHASRGAHIDVSAPGVEIWTALPGRREGPQTGTSFAVPYATAVIAAAYPKDLLTYKGDELDPKGVILAKLDVMDIGPAGPDPIYGRGLLQAPRTCAQPGPSSGAVAWSTTLQGTPAAQAKWPGAVQQLSWQP